MYNLKKFGGSFKGLIGECMFKLTREHAFLVRFHNKNKFLEVWNRILTSDQKEFIYKNWYSLDAIEVVNNQVILYEIKTRNSYRKPLYFKPKMTLQTHNLYLEAKRLGFIIKLVTIWLFDDWNYDVEISDLNEKDYCIDKEKIYD